MLNRVEKWVAQEGTQVLEQKAREIFPRVAEEIIRSEPPSPPLPDIEAEMRSLREAMLSRVEKWAAQEGTQVLERVAREIFPRVAEEVIRQEIEKLKKEAEENE
jgi:dihydroneopterin aldolase